MLQAAISGGGITQDLVSLWLSLPSWWKYCEEARPHFFYSRSGSRRQIMKALLKTHIKVLKGVPHTMGVVWGRAGQAWNLSSKCGPMGLTGDPPSPAPNIEVKPYTPRLWRPIHGRGRMLKQSLGLLQLCSVVQPRGCHCCSV